MLIRAALAVMSGLLLASACGPAEEDIACCAIEPKAKCESALAAIGVTDAEQVALHTPRPICPSDALSAERIRELDPKWPQACREAGLMSPQIDAGRC